MRIDGERFSADLDSKGNIQKIVFKDKLFETPMKYTLYEIDGEIAEVSQLPSDKELILKLTTREASGRLIFSSGKQVKIRLEPDKEDAAKNVSLVIPFPQETEFHLPEQHSRARKIDADMPPGAQYSTRLRYNFFVAKLTDFWVRFMTKQPDNVYQIHNKASVEISRHPEVFVATFTWNAADEALIAVFPSMNEAVRDYECWLEKELGVRRLRDDPNVPRWVHNVKLVLTVDMMRSNWEIAHDYNDIINLAAELGRLGCPKNTLFYIPGWNGAYDSTYPTYAPHPELGGEEKFREMIESLHRNGFRVMIHTNAWGLDPYHPDIDKYLEYALKDKNGRYAGFQTGSFTKWGIMAPPSRPLKFRTGKIPIAAPEKAKSFTFETVLVPDGCEALITVGDLKVEDARVKFKIDRRSILTSQGWFRDHDECALPFPFLLQPGKNKVQVESIGEVEPDWSESWYKIHYCFTPMNPYTSWTHPILFADTNNPEWNKIFVDEVANAVRKYDIDAIHIDATEYEWNKQVYALLKERLPDIPMAAEGFGTLSALGYWTFAQSAGSESLLDYLDVMQGTTQQGALPDRSGLEELYGWLNKESDVCSFVMDYVKIYPHLCAANAFVPVGKVCNTFPPRLSPRCKGELWKVLRDARRLNYIPALRLNYRNYGLDEDTRKAILEIASW